MRQDSGEPGGDSVADGRYAVGDLVGRGRRARVHAGYDRVLRRPVAVKFLPDARWRAEAGALDLVDHAHVVRLLDGGEDGGRTFLVLPLFTGSLATRIGGGAMSRDDTADVVIGLADALGHVHRAGMIHGGVDASAVLVDDAGRPCWSGLPAPTAAVVPRAVDEDLHALAVLAVHCATGDRTARTAPRGVLDAVRAAAAGGPATPGLRRRLTRSLETVAPAAGPAAVVAHAAARVRPRGRPGFAAVLAAGFAASVLGGIVVDGAPLPARPGAALGAAAPSAAPAGPASSDLGASVRGALDRLETLMTASPGPPAAPVETREPPVVRLARDDTPDEPRTRTQADRPATTAPSHRNGSTEDTPGTDRRGDDGPAAQGDDGLPGLVRGVLSGLL